MSDRTNGDSLRLSMYLESTPDDVYYKNDKLQFTRVSKSLAARFGRSVEEVIGRTDFDFFDEATAREYQKVENEILRTGVPIIDREVKHIWPAHSGQPPRERWSLNVALPMWENGRVIGIMGTNKDITETKLTREALKAANRELRAQKERAEYIADHDLLTGLANRIRFSTLLNRSIIEARHNGGSLSVAFLDVDRFKQINDTLGHETGDGLLREVAIRLKTCVRETDVVARLGGDEFVILLPGSEHYAAAVAEKILSAIAMPFTLLRQEFRVTTSIGISVYPQNGRDEQALIKNADIAMYHAKQEGRNNCQFYSDRLNADSLERLALESSLRHALEREEFRLHYQAKRGIGSGNITGVEALLRWEHPDLGTIAPMRFIPVAEETGLIVPIGKWVLRTACAQNVKWQREGLPAVSIAVNVTARQLCNEHLLQDVKSILESTGMTPELLELEIAESLLIRDVEESLRILTALKSLGVRIAVDDFGTGYSSVAMLQRFPLDTVKIDRSFIRDIAGLPEATGLADAIIAIGRRLGLTVVAQGVENRSQAEFLNTHACDELQGFYFDRPLPADQFTELLEAQASGTTYIGVGHGTGK
ncbi:MAG: putative bifunctional diguanylate cyclase/phosphodiesterase [Steroidobacteraceae bacterium]